MVGNLLKITIGQSILLSSVAWRVNYSVVVVSYSSVWGSLSIDNHNLTLNHRQFWGSDFWYTTTVYWHQDCQVGPGTRQTVTSIA